MIHDWSTRTYFRFWRLSLVRTRQMDGDCFWYSLAVLLPGGLSFNVHLGRPVKELRHR